MSQGTIFINNRTQNIRIPADMRFPADVKTVTVRAVGRERIISPIENTWDSFFLGGEAVSDDFMIERADQTQKTRESLDD
ncbi:type II toxin-antitoxin system VapB family antitoxin [Pseudomonas gingeri]|uniref:type II toxin-antitoxin system VapB family antitoxin n=1 Tax=Pseudomonas gingeri TaxID=117681 RepID=UPI0015A1555C|nr:type II toxin-antitoxin system VapB family antitoxin [Pseudomonas gingeri]NWA10636.1 antitoxin [Pseudomonas gingeri]